MINVASKLMILVSFMIILTVVVFAQESFTESNLSIEEYLGSTEAVCTEQLQICVDEFNRLLEDFREGTNCGGTSFNLLKKSNSRMSDEIENLTLENDKVKIYRFGFYSMLILVVITAVVLIVQGIKDDD